MDFTKDKPRIAPSHMKVIKNFYKFLPWGIFLFLFIFFTALSFNRLYSFQIFYYDFGIFARIIWQLSRFTAPVFDHEVLDKIFFLADHFNPSLVILAPLFWLTSNVKVLLIEQAAALTFSGVLIYFIAKKLKLAPLPSLLVALSYLFFAGVENPLVTDWHPEPTAGFFLLLFFYFFCFTKKRWLSYVSAFIFLGFKESNPVTFIFLLAFLFFVKKEKRKEIMGLALISIVWFFIAVNIIIPYLLQRPSIYIPELPQSVGQFAQSFMERPDKLRLIYFSFVSFGFLPLLFPAGLIPIMGELAIRLIPSSSKYDSFSLGMHYNVFLGVFLALASLYAIVTLRQFFKNKRIVYILALYLFCAALLVARKVTFSPINLAVNPLFWQNLKAQPRLQRAIGKVPKKGSIMSQNNLLSHFVARREDVLLFSRARFKKKKPDIILLDAAPNQNPNNFWNTAASEEELFRIIRALMRDKTYTRVAVGDPYIFLFIRR